MDARMQNEIDLNECDRSEIDLGPQLHDTGLCFISDCPAKSVITTMFDFAADFDTDVRNVSNSASYMHGHRNVSD